ncbi:LuxR family transcriptional regulator [Verrucosispora sp. WMMD1129]|uniref:LuxR C-terminal-related transcriptional regulator n=1 Tax=Verrucosispora sp. WMMD1129 TaxID=3016093 RepID=UPI00249C5384|nr:LuxR family transcriptional regulator [Verrucosispora sp. WMMD1129]WFE47743.1 LuxR C-terminal-related transcriptional regulator [Verrucosispora sp. WMMD1129]
MEGSRATVIDRTVPFVGREAQLARLIDTITLRPGAVIVTGAPGVGKTRLAEEALRVLAGRGWRCLRGYAVAAGRDIPLAALSGIVPAMPPIDADGPAGLLAGVVTALNSLAETGRIVVFVDDVHQLDNVSAVALHQAVRAGSLALLATLPTGAEVPETIGALWRSGRAARMDVDPLDAADLEQVLVGWLGGPVACGTLDQVRRATAGNPLYLRELVLAAHDSGALTHDNELWQLRELPAAAGRLDDLVRCRLAGLDSAERTALEVLALAEPVGVRLLHDVLGGDVVETLERRGLITVRADGRRWEAQLAHPLYGEVLRGRIPTSTRLRWYRRLADALEAYGVRRWSDLLPWAVWRVDGGGPADSALIAAAVREVADQPADPRLRERLAQAAWESTADLDAGLLRCRVLIEQGRTGAALTALEDVAAHAGDDRARRDVATARSWFLGWCHGSVADALWRLRQDAAALADPVSQVTLRVDRANLLACAGRPRHAARLVADVDVADSPELTVRVAAVQGVGLLLSGQLDQLRTALAGAVAPPVSRCAMYPAEYASGALPVDVWAYDGMIAQARETGHEVLTHTYGLGDRIAHASALTSLALAEITAGALGTARRYVTEALPVLRDFGVRHHEGRCLAAGLLAATYQGDEAAADRFESRLAEIWPALAQIELFRFEVDRARAWRWWQRGEPGAAHALLAASARRWDHRGGLLPAVLLASDLARMGEPTTAARLLPADPIPARWGLGVALVDLVRALAAPDVAELERVAAILAELGCHLYAAEATAAAAVAGARRRATGRTGTGVRRGEVDDAARAKARAAVAAGRCDNARTPLLASVGDRSHLTRREREIAALVARELSNQAVAEQLALSIRTVENHLNRIFAKLGVHGRAELADVLRQGRRDQL